MQNEVIFIHNLLRSYLNIKDKNFNIEKYSLNYDGLLKKIFASGLEGIAFYELNRLEILNSFPQEIVDKLKWGARNTLMVNMLLYNEFLNTLKVLKKNGINAVPVKGILLVKELYENMSLRPMADLDFFVSEDEYYSAIEIIKGLDYKESDFIPKRKWEIENFRVSLTKREGFPVTLELHRRFAHPGRFNLSITDAFANTVLIRVEDEDIRIFNQDFSFLFMIHHLGMHYFNIKLIWLVDLVKFLCKVELDWDKIIEYVDRYKLKNVFYLTMKLIKPYIKEYRLPEDYYQPGWIKRAYFNFFFTHRSLNFFRFPKINLRLAQVFAEIPLIDNWHDRTKFLRTYLKIRIDDYL